MCILCTTHQKVMVGCGAVEEPLTYGAGAVKGGVGVSSEKVERDSPPTEHYKYHLETQAEHT